jgi:hypothetical protein
MKNEYLQHPDFTPIVSTPDELSQEFIEIIRPESVEVVDQYPDTVEIVDEYLELLEVSKEGPQGPPGEPTTYRYIAGETLSGHRVVALSTSNHVLYASNTNTSQLNTVLGITTGAALGGEYVNVKFAGMLVEPTWNWAPGLPVYLGANGVLTQTIPTLENGSLFILYMGNPITPTTLYINIKIPIILS